MQLPGASGDWGAMRRIVIAIGLWASLALVLCFLTLPVAAVLVSAPPSELLDALGSPEARDALLLSLGCSTAALLVIVAVGTPAAWLLATRGFRGRAIVTTLVELPLVLPPAVAGIGLLLAFGPLGLLGGALDALGVRLVLETAGVIVALVFVAAPFHIRQAQAAFEGLDRSLLDAAATLGADEGRTFIRVAVPTAAPALLSGAALAWGRALGEFGATLMFAGSLRAVTQTAPLAIYEGFATDLVAAQAIAAVLVAASAAILAASKLVLREGRHGIA